ncbi:glycosyl hydrolase [Aspergillus unguis]
MPFKNPILPGTNPDPSIIRVGKDYFLVTSSFEYTPSIPIYHSTDLIKWTLISHALTRPSQLQIHTPEPGGGVWATTIRYHRGVFYITAASFERYRPQADERVWPRGFVVHTTDIWDVGKGWSEPVWFDCVGFDQDLFFDDDDTVYLSSTYRKHTRTPVPESQPPLKDFAIHISTIDLSTGTPTSAPKLIRSSPSGVSEGSHIFKRNGIYYLFTAEGGTESGHCEWVFRSRESPFGPWEAGPVNPLWRNGVNDEIQNTGHADFVEDVHGDWWAVFLGVRPVWRENERRWEESVFGRETFLVPVSWQNDWPVVNSGKGIVTLNIDTPQLYEYTPPVDWRDDFASEELQLGWYRKNTPVKKDYTLLASEPGKGKRGLRLHGAPYTLSTPSCPTMFLRKQTARHCIFETELRFFPDSLHVEAGCVVYFNYFTWVSIGIRLAPESDSHTSEGNGEQRIVRFTPSNTTHGNGFSSQSTDIPLSSSTSAVRLQIQCGDAYQFGFREILPDSTSSLVPAESHSSADGKVHWVGEVSNRALVEAPLPVGAPFTGAMLGIYSVGDREAVRVPADFAYVEVKG